MHGVFVKCDQLIKRFQTVSFFKISKTKLRIVVSNVDKLVVVFVCCNADPFLGDTNSGQMYGSSKGFTEAWLGLEDEILLSLGTLASPRLYKTSNRHDQ